MAGGTPPALVLQPRRSRRLAAALIGLHGLALLAIGLSTLAPLWQLGLAAAVLWQGWWTWQRHLRLPAGRRLTWRPDGAWVEERAPGQVQVIEDWQASVIHPALVVLRWRVSGEPWRSELLAADSLPAATHRRLRVRLQAQRAASRGQ